MAAQALANIPLFAELESTELAALSRLLKTRSVAANDTIFWIGDSGDELFIVESGAVQVSYPDEQGREVTLAVLRPGQFFGDLSLLDGGARTATARATDPTVLLSLSRRDFIDFLKAHPSAAVEVLGVLGHRQRETLERLRSVRNVNEEIEQRATRWQRIADVIAAISASQTFVLLHLFWFGGWIGYNLVRGKDGPDPFPFGLLTMVVSLEAIFLSIFVLISQNRSGEKDRLRADLDYQVNRKAQLEIMQLHEKMDRIENALNDRVGQGK